MPAAVTAYQRKRYGLWRAYARARVQGSHLTGHTWLKKCERLYQGISRYRPSRSFGRPRCVNVGGSGIGGGDGGGGSSGVDGGGYGDGGGGGEPPLQ